VTRLAADAERVLAQASGLLVDARTPAP